MIRNYISFLHFSSTVFGDHYIPKGTEFTNIENSVLKEIQNKLNNRPRKILGFLTPIEYTKKYYNEMKN